MKKIFLIAVMVLAMASTSYGAVNVCISLTAAQDAAADRADGNSPKSKKQIFKEYGLDEVRRINKAKRNANLGTINDATQDYIDSTLAEIKSRCGTPCD